jgi:glyceraldehyde 3-phosphate dehydrogenase
MEVTYDKDHIIVGDHKILVLAEKDPANLPWGDLGVSIAIEATGKLKSAEKAKAHLAAGAKKVIISAPAKDADITVVMGANQDKYNPKLHHVISNASCTTNCLAPAAKVINDKFGIVEGVMTTVHAATGSQNIVDGTNKDPRRARSVFGNIIPTTTGAAKAVSLVLPELNGKLDGLAIRVPTQNVSIVDLVVKLAKATTAEEINTALSIAAKEELSGILSICELPLVSVDFNGDSHSSIVDALSTMVIGDSLAKLLLWYDNEWAYSCRVVDLLLHIADHLL